MKSHTAQLPMGLKKSFLEPGDIVRLPQYRFEDPVEETILLFELTHPAHYEHFGPGGNVLEGSELQEFWRGLDSQGREHFITIGEVQFGHITPTNRTLMVEF